MLSTLVIIPTYNEAENLQGAVANVLDAVEVDVEVLVVDDGSPDGTGRLADELADADPRLHVLHRDSKQGLGPAYLAGFAWALDRGYDAVVEMDADGSHRAVYLPRLLDSLALCDVVLGSRWCPGGRVENWPKHRLMLSRGGNAYARWALSLPVHDATGGYRAIRTTVLRQALQRPMSSQGYCFQVDLLRRLLDQGADVIELPITFSDRERGTSKMSGAIVAEAMLQVTRWAVQRRWSALRSHLHPRAPEPPQPVG